jgi:uncharacterized protein (DUF433 family)
MEPLVTKNRDVAWGKPVIAGTRVPVETLFDYLERGKSLDDFLREFPTVDRSKAVAILESAKEEVSAAAAER